MSRSFEQHYFVLHLSERDSPPQQPGKEFEIQILDFKGQAALCGYIGSDDHILEVEGNTIPSAVLEAAKRQPKGQGDYVDSDGNSLQPI